MLTATAYTITADQLAHAQKSIDLAVSRNRLNRATGRFFYDPWQIDPKYSNTVWADILGSLPQPIGEARIITLKPQSCYSQHADIDNRWHLNLTGEAGYLVNLDHHSTYPLRADCTWYMMQAQHVHTAMNVGRDFRSQLVVRQLLTAGNFESHVHVRITSHRFTADDSRYVFDTTISPWLNRQDKLGHIRDFEFYSLGVSFTMLDSLVDELRDLVSTNFQLMLE